MATRTEVLLIDDVDGSNASETVAFALDGVTYEIDLSDDNASRLRADMSTWTEKARRTGGRAKKAGTVASTSTRSTSPNRSAYLKELRSWARDNGFSVPDRGRIPVEAEQAYEAHLAS